MIATKVPALLLLCTIKYSTYNSRSYTLALSDDFLLPIPRIFPLIGFPGNAESGLLRDYCTFNNGKKLPYT
jgi:hypothetical protein